MRLPTQWLGVAPFFIFALMFLILPTLYLIIGAFQNPAGEFTLENIAALSQPSIIAAYWISIKVSFASALLGALIGLAIAIAIVRGGLPSWVRSTTHDILGRRLEFRRRAAGLRLPRHARPARPRHRPAEHCVRLQHLRDSASTSCPSGA